MMDTLPVVYVANGALFDVERRESVLLALGQDKIDEARVAFFMTHDFDGYIGQ